MPVADMVGAIRGGDIARLTRIPGIGKKTAERMVLELRDKLESFGQGAAAPAASPVEEDVLSALVNLGYQRPAAERALARASCTPTDGRNFDVLFREALGALSR
jgi:Holliday junction DNA helicase RuvA